jgi:HEAT repeat protein
LAFDGQQPPYRQGELVGFKVYVRNVGDKEVPLVVSYSDDEVLYHSKLRVKGSEDEPIQMERVYMPAIGGLEGGTLQDILLRPGQMKMLGKKYLLIGPGLQDKRAEYRAHLKPGQYRVTNSGEWGKYRLTDVLERGLSEQWPSVKLTTGQLEFTVQDEADVPWGGAVEGLQSRLRTLPDKDEGDAIEQWPAANIEAATRKNPETQALKILFADANLPCGVRRVEKNGTWNDPYRYVIHSYPDYLDACQYIFMRQRGGGAEGRWFNTGDIVVSQPCWLYAAVWKPSDNQRQTWEKEGWEILPDILQDLGDPRRTPRPVRDYMLMRKRVHKGPVDFETKAEKAHMVIWVFDEILLAQYEIIRLSATLEVDPAELARESVEGAKLAALIEGLKDKDSSVRSKAAAALTKMGPAAKPAIPALMYALMSDPSRSVRSNAACALGRIKDPIAVPALIIALKDIDEYVHRGARNALIIIGKPAVERLIVALKVKNLQMRLHAAEALRQIGDKTAAGAFIAALRDRSPKVRELAAWALGGLQDNRAVTPLIGCLNDEHKVRVRAIEALGKLRDSRAVEPLIVLLQDKNSELRRRAAQSLGMIGDNRAVESLIPLLTDDRICHNVAWALGEIADKRAVEPLIARLNRELQHRPPRSYLHDVAEALGKIKDERAIGPLISALKATRPPVLRPRTLKNWTEPDDEAYLILLVKTLRDNYEGPRYHVAWALVQIGQPAVKALTVAAQSDDRWLSGAAEAILKKIQ